MKWQDRDQRRDISQAIDGLSWWSGCRSGNRKRYQSIGLHNPITWYKCRRRGSCWMTTVLIFICLFVPNMCEYVREFEISEGVPVGTSLGFIGDSNPGSPKPPPPPYLIVPVPGSAVDSDLNIEQSNGEIRTRVVLDREVRSSYSLVAIPLAGENIRVLINVKDENDNAPVFPQSYLHIEFPENTPRDVKRTLPPARDLDLGIYNTQRYNIASGNTNNAFRLSSHRERDGVLYLDLQINGFLDRELASFYSLVIEALDGGNPPLKGQMTVNITIQDVNDNQPIFNQSRYFATVPENATIGTSVMQVFATDTDSGDNGRITYSINRRQSDRDSMFVINAQTGVISVNRLLDFETKEVHELVVVASDNGLQPLETTAFVSIRVSDVNDNQPTINLIFLSDDATPKISEDAQPGEFVARISVNDPDSKEEYANVNVTLEGGDGHFGLTTRDNIIYLMIVSLPLDREMKPNYTLLVTATDQGNPPLHATREFELIVTDTNDNPPEFDRTIYYANVLEVADPGTSVFQLSALDRDEGNNSIVTYSIVDTPETHSDWFQIDPKTGLITTRKHIDCETDPVPQLTILAVDSGDPPLSGSTTVRVTIRDVNDNEPIFDQSFFNVSVAEDEIVGHCVLKVSATDPDCGVNALVNYTVGEGFLKNGEFEVRPTTGEICISSAIDHEKRSLYEFPVIATDRGGLSTTAMVKIQVSDINDNRPIFYPREYNVSLRERETFTTPIVVVVATDKDSGKFGSVRYAITAGNDNNLFRIEALTGEIYVQRPLSKSKPMHRLNISATDGGGLKSILDAEVLVSVIDSSHQPPTFEKARYTFSVREDVERNAVVGTVAASSVTDDNIRYSIYSGDPESYFTISSETGVIRTNSPLDHEVHPYVLLNVAATSGEPPSFGHTQVNITIGDINDNAPEFDTPVVKISVPENAELGSAIYAAHADDMDGGENGVVRYELQTNPDQTFRIDSKLGYLSLAKNLDYETTQKYSLVIVAIDGGNPPLRSNVTLNIEVQDVNDNLPVFEKKEYQVNVLETLAANTQFLQVKATDLDTGNNARLTYKIKEEETENVFGIFPNSGSLYLKEVLDREAHDKYTFTVIAMDNGTPPGSASTSVTVQVLDANDNDPVFSKSFYEFKIEENSERGTFVGQVVATDKDVDANADLRYNLDHANGTFQMNPTTGEIVVRQSLDRETKSSYDLHADVRDLGNPPRSSRAKVRIIVTDKNDNAPTIVEPEEGIVTIREEMPPGTEVTRVRAVDIDEGENATITYRIVKHEGDASSIFTIDETTGIVRARVTLDHEDRPLYRLTVAAQDRGRPPKETQKLLQIEVLDLNDNRPTFSTSTVVFKVSEDVPIGTEIGTVVAEDRDVGENGRISYILISGNLYGCFDINKSTGTLYTVQELNRELASQFNLQIRAIDSSATNPQSNVINVKIEIEDVNDNAPVFKEDPIIFSVSESLPVGSPVWNFSVTDPDEGQNSVVQFSITQQWPFSAFKVNSNSGILSIIAPLDYEQHPDFTLVVAATDQAEKEEDRLTTTVTVRIFVEDYNDNPPVFVSRTRVDIMEDEPVGFPILHVIAIDRDSRDNGRVSYNIVSGNDGNLFTIDANTGMLSLTKPLNRGTDAFKLNVTATDHGKPPRTSFNIIEVKVEGLNDSPPRFTQPVYQASVQENAAPNTFVIKLTAADKETENLSNLTYSLPSGVADGKFNIDPSSGSITTTGSLDRETVASYVLTVYVHDSSVPVQYDTATVTIEVLDVNDHTPDFGDSCYPLSIPENNEFSVIHTVVATDADSGINGEVTYSIVGGNFGNKFSVDLHTGQLSSRPLDRETRDRYQLVIAAQDRGTPPRQGLCNVTVIVDDENDNDPKFTQNRYTATVSEDAAAGTPVLTVQALDPDRGSNAKVTYALSNETHWLFKIDNITGVISTAGTFDREQKSSYTFEVRATDGGRYDARSERAQVHITIGDVNDNKPVFTQYPFTVDVSTFLQPDQQIVKVVAEDKDEGPNGEVVYSFLGDASSRFRINPTSGIITTLSSFTMETGRLLHLEVIARDRGSPSLSSTGLVQIRVGDGSGNDPLLGSPTLRFQNSSYSIRLQENAPVGRDVVQVLAVRSDGRRQRINYSFGSGNEDLTFEINSNNGLIRVRDPKNLDFEMNQRFKLIVVAQAEGPAPLYGYATVWVELTDQNDNAPRFTQDHYMASVWEGNNKGTFVMQVSAADSDSNANANVAYHIVDGNYDNAFIIEPPFSGIIKTNIVLDREIRDSYRLTIIATDDGSPQLTGTCSLRINIVDVNDNQPTFPPYSVVSVSEGSVVGTVITTITANDVDTNPTLVYDFADGGNPDKRFAIDRFSGRITLAASLDHEKQSRYTLRVQASDSAHVTETSLMVTVLDENDNAPVFSQYSYEVLVPELTDSGRPILTVNATDRDSGLNAKIRYSIVSGLWEGFYIGEDTGVIFANRTIPYDPRRSVMYLIVKAEDSGKPPRSSVAPVRIVIADVNNHAPKFTQETYSVTLPEDSPRGTTVIQVTANDRDETRDNRNIDYFIEAGNINSTFQITSDSGEIVLVRPVDREEILMFQLKVLAMDRGSPSRNATADVIITIEDTNDNPPLFNQSLFEVSISEAQSVGSPVIQLGANDKDEGDNGRIRYDITSGNELSMFEIDAVSGIVTVKKTLDYDKKPEYKLVVRASDGHKRHPLSAITALTVKLLDENDNVPVFPVSQYQEYIAENMPVGSSVFTAKANDLDKGVFGQLNYTISESDGNNFAVDKLSGVVTTNAVFDYETKNKYYFVITATDPGGMTASAQVQVEIESRDEFAPEFDERSYSFLMRGDAEVGYIVGRVHATDKDKGPDGRVVYQFRNNHPNFKINKTNGIISVKKPLDDKIGGRRKRELQEQPSVSLVVVASSGRFGSLTNMTVVEVNVDGDGLLSTSEVGASVGMADWALGLLISLVFLVVGFIATLVFLHIRHRRQSNQSDNPHGKEPIASMSEHHYDQSTFDTLSYPPEYDNMPGYDPTDRRHRHTNTTSEISDQSHSASSGRGSAEEGENDVDEEIRMINEGPLRQQQQAAKLQRLGLTVLVPDSGIHGDDDNLSDVSVQNTQEYLARLGIDTSRSDLPDAALALPPHLTHPHSHSLASMHIYDESGGAETESMDFSNLIYAKLNDDSNGSVIEGQRPYGYVVDDSQPSMTGSLSSIVHSEEELTGSYNWDYLLDWGPQYQPLAHVFGEIARLKDDTLPDDYSSGSSVSKKSVNAPVKTVPPPLITNVAPRTIVPVATNRIGYPNVPMLPRSPINHESSFAGPALSPSFSPSLSPLATRSPSISPMVASGLVRSSRSAVNAPSTSSEAEMRL